MWYHIVLYKKCLWLCLCGGCWVFLFDGIIIRESVVVILKSIYRQCTFYFSTLEIMGYDCVMVWEQCMWDFLF